MIDGFGEDEELHVVNDGLKLIQKKSGLKFGTDALLLAAFIKKHSKSVKAIEIGSGTGIISLLALEREKLHSVTALEVQPDYAALTARNAELNGLSDRLNAVCADARDYMPEKEADLVFSNPPFMKTKAGKENGDEGKFAARHEVNGTIGQICSAASKMLKYGGCFDVVYRPDRLTELLCAMRGTGIEPKTVLFAAQSPSHAPCLVLVEGKKGASEGNTVPQTFFLKNEQGADTQGYQTMLETGSLPDPIRK